MLRHLATFFMLTFYPYFLIVSIFYSLYNIFKDITLSKKEITIYFAFLCILLMIQVVTAYFLPFRMERWRYIHMAYNLATKLKLGRCFEGSLENCIPYFSDHSIGPSAILVPLFYITDNVTIVLLAIKVLMSVAFATSLLFLGKVIDIKKLVLILMIYSPLIYGTLTIPYFYPEYLTMLFASLLILHYVRGTLNLFIVGVSANFGLEYISFIPLLFRKLIKDKLLTIQDKREFALKMLGIVLIVYPMYLTAQNVVNFIGFLSLSNLVKNVKFYLQFSPVFFIYSIFPIVMFLEHLIRKKEINETYILGIYTLLWFIYLMYPLIGEIRYFLIVFPLFAYALSIVDTKLLLGGILSIFSIKDSGRYTGDSIENAITISKFVKENISPDMPILVIHFYDMWGFQFLLRNRYFYNIYSFPMSLREFIFISTPACDYRFFHYDEICKVISSDCRELFKENEYYSVFICNSTQRIKNTIENVRMQRLP